MLTVIHNLLLDCLKFIDLYLYPKTSDFKVRDFKNSKICAGIK